MHRQVIGWTALFAALLMLISAPLHAQDGAALGYALPDTLLPTPLSSTRPEEGVYFGGAFTMDVQTMPLENQEVAFRGFKDIENNSGFIGSHKVALETKQITGPESQQPGFKVFGGYRFFDGSALELSWRHTSTIRHSAVATPIPQDLRVGIAFEESFLFSPVGNYPLEFAGPSNDVNGASAFGIWNATDNMTIDFTQRLEQYELVYRMAPFYESETYRTAAFVGPRFVWFWERFRWRAFDFDLDGLGTDVWNAFYTNIISNRMYGLKMGCSNDWYLGNGLSVTFDPWVTPMVNFVKKRAKYERGDINIGPERKRSDIDYTLVPELGVSLGINWYPYEGIQVKACYNIQAYFNTLTSEEPIDFNYSAINPEYNRQFRMIRGFDIGVAFKF